MSVDLIDLTDTETETVTPEPCLVVVVDEPCPHAAAWETLLACRVTGSSTRAPLCALHLHELTTGAVGFICQRCPDSASCIDLIAVIPIGGTT